MSTQNQPDPKRKIAPSQKAVALHYRPSDIAPKVVAKGAGYVADRIVEKGVENDVPIYKDPSLVEELTRIDIGDNIPPELYEIVAQVLLFIGDLDRLQGYKDEAEKQGSRP